MRGDLSETSVADLCRGLSDAEATGAVELDGPEGAARVFFRQGNVYWAMSPAPRARLGDRLVNGGLLSADQLEQALAAQRESSERLKLGAILADQGLVTRDVIRVFVQEQILDALFDLMRWNVGNYAFRAGDAANEKLPIDIPVDQLLVEVSRRQSEWNQIEAVIPDLDMIPDFVLGGSSANAALEPDEFAVLASVDGHRTIRELAAALGYSEFEAARIVYGLTLLGIVDVSDDEAEELDAEDDDLYGEVAGAFDRPTDMAEPPVPHADLDEFDAGDLELELSDLAEDDVDIAAALEEALSGDAGPDTDDAPPGERPQVRVHVDDDLTDYVAPRTVTDAGLPPAGEPLRRTPVKDPSPAPTTPSRAAEVEATDTDELSAALAEALELDPEEPWDDATAEPAADLSGDVPDDVAADDRFDDVSDDSSDGGPEPWVAPPLDVAEDASTPSTVEGGSARLEGVDDDLFGAIADAEGQAQDDAEDQRSPSPAEESAEAKSALDGPAGDDTSATASERAPDPVDDDSDFDALIDQLAGSPDGASNGGGASYTSAPSPKEHVAPESPSEPDPEPARGGGDVSEFLRELSRLALDEPGEGGAPAAPATDDAEPEDEKDAAASAAADAREASRQESEDKKKRGLFGWGR